MKRSSAVWLTLILVVTLGRIAATWRIFNVTYDEPVHVAAGYDYLEHHTFLDRQHPPLPKALFAMLLLNAPEPDSMEWIRRGNSILGDHEHYLRGTAKTRAGNLVFVVIAILALFFWTRDLFDETIALIAVAIFANLPPVLAHGAIATTDMAATAAFAVGMLAYDRWLARPSWRRTIALAVAIAFGSLCKFSFPLFFLIGAAFLSIARGKFGGIRRAAAAIAVAFAVIWGVYFFSAGTMESVERRSRDWMLETFHTSGIEQWHIPAPAFFAGLLEVVHHDHIGHQTFLLGEYRDRGWWYYFPVALAVKTPLPMLALAIAGAILAARRKQHRVLAAIALGILASAMLSRINIGVRHILPMYVPMSMLAAWVAVAGWRSSQRDRIAVAIAATWLVADSVFAHPDYLPWMNVLAGPHPEHVLADSNFDWGQDLLRLKRECRARGIQRMGVFFVSAAASDALGLPLFDPNPIQPYTPVTGWVAVGETPIQMAQAQDPKAYLWLTNNRNFIRVGKTIRLYHME